MVEEVIGTAAKGGADLAAGGAHGDRVNAATGSMGMALTSCAAAFGWSC